LLFLYALLLTSSGLKIIQIALVRARQSRYNLAP
jgi:hypothetical protein